MEKSRKREQSDAQFTPAEIPCGDLMLSAISSFWRREPVIAVSFLIGGACK